MAFEGARTTTFRKESAKRCFNFARQAGCNRELEKADLLLPARPDNAQRRPADVYIPTWIHGLPAELDFAITAPQQQRIVDRAATNALAAATEYCDTKRAHENTQAACDAAGITFIPMVAETTRAWAPESLAVWKQLAVAAAIRQDRDAKVVMREMLQSLSVTIRRANAKAFLRRSAG